MDFSWKQINSWKRIDYNTVEAKLFGNAFENIKIRMDQYVQELAEKLYYEATKRSFGANFGELLELKPFSKEWEFVHMTPDLYKVSKPMLTLSLKEGIEL